MLNDKHKVLNIIDDEIAISENYVQFYVEYLNDSNCSKHNKEHCNKMADYYHDRIMTLLALKSRIRDEI